MKAKVALRKKREGAENNVLVMRIGRTVLTKNI